MTYKRSKRNKKKIEENKQQQEQQQSKCPVSNTGKTVITLHKYTFKQLRSFQIRTRPKRTEPNWIHLYMFKHTNAYFPLKFEIENISLCFFPCFLSHSLCLFSLFSIYFIECALNPCNESNKNRSLELSCCYFRCLCSNVHFCLHFVTLNRSISLETEQLHLFMSFFLTSR